MSSTLTILSAAVTRRIGRPTTDTLVTSSDITAALNDAANRFAGSYPWPWLETSENISTTTGTDTYVAVTGTPTVYIDTIRVHIAGNPPLTRMSAAELQRQFPSTASGSPLFYARLGGSLIVRPIPITTVLPTLIHTYHRTETALSAGGDVLLCPATFEMAIVELAANELFRRAKDRESARDALEQYVQIRNEALEYVRRFVDQSDGNDLIPPQPQMALPGKG